tara:strand:+ start:2271 stop:2870 length:600 start_codon:yes stop_codon:yes gene_type:complete
MRIRIRESKKIEEEFDLGSTATSISNMSSAIQAIKNGESFSFPVNTETLSKFEALTPQSEFGESGDLTSVDPKLILAIGGTIAVLILVAFALNYAVKLKAKVPGGEGEIVFEPRNGNEEPLDEGVFDFVSDKVDDTKAKMRAQAKASLTEFFRNSADSLAAQIIPGDNMLTRPFERMLANAMRERSDEMADCVLDISGF